MTFGCTLTLRHVFPHIHSGKAGAEERSSHVLATVLSFCATHADTPTYLRRTFIWRCIKYLSSSRDSSGPSFPLGTCFETWECHSSGVLLTSCRLKLMPFMLNYPLVSVWGSCSRCRKNNSHHPQVRLEKKKI